MSKGVARSGPGSNADGRASMGGGDPAAFADQRRRMIAEAAYFRALERDFAPGREIDDWLLAEQDIETTLLQASGSQHRR